MTLCVTDLNPETREKLGIKLEPPLGQAGVRHIALGKVLKAIDRLEEDDALWVIQEARRSLKSQGSLLSSDNSSKYTPPLGWTVQVVAQYFKVSVTDLKHRSRSQEIVQARQVAMYVLGMFNVYTLEEIGEALGGRSPATVSHGFQKIAGRLGHDKKLAKMVKAIREEVR